MNYTEHKQRRTERLRDRSGLPRRYWDTNLDNLTLTDESREAIVAVKAYIAHIKAHAAVGKGIILAGPPGRGKSTLAAAVLESAMLRGGACLYMPVARWQRLLHRSFDAQDDAEMEVLDRIDTDYFVLFDDLGKEHASASGFIENRIESTLRDRYDREQPSIITTNVPMGDWEKTYGEPMYSFAHEAFVWVIVKGNDWRRRG